MNIYETQYIELDFERAGLFKAIREQYPCKEVLYPGCSAHITPSLYFPHVIYVDKSEVAAQFFAEGIAKSCAQYLRPGGLLLTNNHQGDAVDAVHDRKFKLNGRVQFQKGSYRISEASNGITLPAQRRDNNFLKQVNESVQYVENELYYVFECSR